jgi:hypothetical protein
VGEPRASLRVLRALLGSWTRNSAVGGWFRRSEATRKSVAPALLALVFEGDVEPGAEASDLTLLDGEVEPDDLRDAQIA